MYDQKVGQTLKSAELSIYDSVIPRSSFFYLTDVIIDSESNSIADVVQVEENLPETSTFVASFDQLYSGVYFLLNSTVPIRAKNSI